MARDQPLSRSAIFPAADADSEYGESYHPRRRRGADPGGPYLHRRVRTILARRGRSRDLGMGGGNLPEQRRRRVARRHLSSADQHCRPCPGAERRQPSGGTDFGLCEGRTAGRVALFALLADPERGKVELVADRHLYSALFHRAQNRVHQREATGERRVRQI